MKMILHPSIISLRLGSSPLMGELSQKSHSNSDNENLKGS
jgi:hypothetical protein